MCWLVLGSHVFQDFFTPGFTATPSVTNCRAIYSSLTSNHAPSELYSLYSVIQRYTALCTIQLYSLYSIQRYTITLCIGQARLILNAVEKAQKSVLLLF